MSWIIWSLLREVQGLRLHLPPKLLFLKGDTVHGVEFRVKVVRVAAVQRQKNREVKSVGEDPARSG